MIFILIISMLMIAIIRKKGGCESSEKFIHRNETKAIIQGTSPEVIFFCLRNMYPVNHKIPIVHIRLR